ncbi:MAG: hypothetical protein ACPIOQ_24930 [Promethearchaeia archaeon]
MLPELAIMCVFGDLEFRVTIVKPCGSRFVPVPSAAPRRGVRGITYGTSRSSVGTESIREHDSIVTGIGAEHADATSALSDAFPVSEGARPYLCRGRFQRAQKCSWTVHAFPAEPYGRSLSSMLEELAVACGYGVPERHTTILKRCDMKLNAVRLTAHTRKACVWS